MLRYLHQLRPPRLPTIARRDTGTGGAAQN